ncbi:MAG: phosphatase PAP2 family protein [Nitrososphaerota archaeon]|jgi:membrane-associated phospholipid phosphatase|nr:phosphatase PAP2 family protein [Nitrososphaerota archaeon]
MEGIFMQLASKRRVMPLLAFLLIIFAIITAYVKLAGPNNIINSALYMFTIEHRVGFLDGAMVVFSEYGREYFWIPLVAVIWLFGSGRVKFSAYVMIIAFILAIIAGEILKPALAVPRPFYFYDFRLLVPRPTDFSYPSGHALIVWTGASSTFYYLRKRYVYLLSIEALLVSISRVYVGVHWPLDIVGGAVLGVAMAMLAVYIAESNFGTKVYSKVKKLAFRDRG